MTEADYKQAMFNAARDVVTIYGRGNALARADYHLRVYDHQRPAVREEWRKVWGEAIREAVRMSIAEEIQRERLRMVPEDAA